MELWHKYIYKHKRFHIGKHAAYDLIYIIKISQLELSWHSLHKWAHMMGEISSDFNLDNCGKAFV